jgi:predicted ATPase/class 3 adenylate cyclase
MADLPTGMVTFLFTDIEGSTPLWEREPERMRLALARHHAIMRSAIAEQGGHTFKTIGDAFQAAFVLPMHAVAAALAAQRALMAQPWETSAPVLVRMGIHLGPAVAEGSDYRTTHTLNRVARIMAAGHGGQILLSVEVADLVRRELPTDVTLRDLGMQRMKGLTHLEHLFQVVAPDLPTAFPPLTTLDRFRTNLPVQLTSFVGREQEITAIQQLLAAQRLVTLTGPGGTGKTRLALHVAAEVLETFSDGVWLIELAPLADAALAPRAVASVLGLREEADRPILATVTDFLHARTLLLLLDNCEHLVEACAQLADALLHACPNVRILASSREALGVAGEAPFRVPSLRTPDPRRLPPIEALAHYEAVRLFVERGAAVLPGFTVTDANAPALAQVCARLDGIPLALELAAARVNVLRVEQIATRLDDRFRLLTGGSRTAVPRQQTLRALIDWSYDLLAEGERVLLPRLSVFAGGWTLEAAEAVCAGDGIEQSDMLDVLTQLVNKSLVVADREQGQETRYQLLETIRQYALERLAASEGATIRQQHLAYFVQLAERAEPNLRAFDMLVWLNRLEAELDNIRTALEWALETDVEAELRLAGALWWFWHIRSHGNEGCDWLERALSIETIERGEQPIWPARAMICGKALNVAGYLRLMQGETEKGAVCTAESLALFRELGPAGKRGMAYALLNLGVAASHRPDIARAKSLSEESLALFREVGDKFGMAECLESLGDHALADGDPEHARTIWEEGLALRKEIGDRDGIALLYSMLGDLAFRHGDYQRAITLYQESLAGFREVGNKTYVARTLGALGEMAWAYGDYGQAATMAETALAISQESRDELEVALAFHCLGTMAWVRGDHEQAANMFAKELTIGRGMRNRIVVPYALLSLAGVARSHGDDGQAANMYAELLAFDRWKPHVLHGLGRVAQSRGEYAAARAHHAEALAVWQAAGLRFGVPLSLEALASLATAQQQAEWAARLFGSAEALQEVFHFILAPADRADHDRDVATARAALGEAAFAAAWAAGRAMTMEQAIDEALNH